MALGVAAMVAGTLALGCAARSADDRPAAPKPLYDPDAVLAEEARQRAMAADYVPGQSGRGYLSSDSPRTIDFDRLVTRKRKPKPEPPPAADAEPAPSESADSPRATEDAGDAIAPAVTGPGGYPPHFPYVDRVRVGNGIYRRVWSGPNTYILDSRPERTATGFQYSATSGAHLWHTRTRGGGDAAPAHDPHATYSGTVYPGNQAYGYRR